MSESIPQEFPGFDEQVVSLKTPPHSVEAEQSVLGGLLLDNNAWETVSDKLVETDFYNPSHRTLYRMIAELVAESEPFDPLTLSERLDSHGELDKVGGLAYLTELVQSTPSISNIRAYAEIIFERSVMRKLIKASTQIADRAYNPEGRNSTELLDEAEREVFQIAESRPKSGGPVEVKELLGKAIDRIDQLFNSGGGLTGLTTGFTDLDEMTSGLQPSDMIIVAGRPSMGKTTFAMNLVENALLNSDKTMLVFSLEMPADQLVARMLSSLGRIDATRMRAGSLEDEDWPKLTSAVTMLNDKKLLIDDTAGISPSEMRSRARRVVREHGDLGLIMIDYLQLMQIPGGGENRTNEISEISRSLKAIAKEFEVPVVALSQLNRSLENRPNKRPVNSDLRESGAIEQDADVIMFVYRDEVYNPDTEFKGVAEIIIGKQRNGPIGTARMAFVGKYTRFENLAPGAYDGYGFE
ncbi:replicative DNA helicase [Aestuariirhabdus sp. Z084]|uniref:replicative DNA helicase n=1 Tax=Aestuariirhabdus haliotis TaxID=2918751 RepID=UPI00201B41E4|nr:replicative DNA helicase [Aestuariirhabdus haliotis]MCL6415651.1 replicative DNA helicase [Aestuariirhabdus haliotis]MCL6419646.1 replicative DNA helicase [Aestuariirhabdus haliotis]